MASAHRYRWTRADGTVGEAWRAKWTGPTGPDSKRGFDRERDALAFAQDREVEGRHGVTLGDVVPTGRTTVEAWSKLWLSGVEVRDSSAENYRYAVKRINTSLGGRSLVSLRPSELKAWRKGLTGRYAPSTAAHTASILAMMLRAAVLDGLIDKSPLPPVSGGAHGRVVDPDELLTLPQVRAWGAAMPLVCREMPVVAAATGLRQGELLGLRLPNVDFLRRQIRVLEQLVTPAGKGTPTWGPPKTAAGERTVPLPAVAAEALARHLARFPAVPGEPIFRTVRGRRWRRAHFGETWHAGRDAAGLPGWAHWHALRDVAASGLIRQGNDVRTVMAILGHTSSEETLRTYARLWPDAQDRARVSLDELWQEPQDEQQPAVDGEP